MKTKVKWIAQDAIGFEDGSELTTSHQQDCCENHYLDFSHLSMEDFSSLEFDLSNDNFFERVEDYGIRLIPVEGYPVNVPGYGYNNGYYSHELTLELKTKERYKEYDITSCQTVSG